MFVHATATVVALAAILVAPVRWPMPERALLFAGSWIASASGVYFVAAFAWETMADALESRMRDRLAEDRLHGELTRYRRRLRIVRAVHRSRLPDDTRERVD